jgi:hypothetical protein
MFHINRILPLLLLYPAHCIAQVTSFDFIGSNAADWYSAASQPYAVTTTSPGTVDSVYDNFLAYSSLPAPFRAYTFAVGDVMTLRGNFRLLSSSAMGQMLVANTTSGFFGFGVTFTNLIGDDLIRVWTFDGFTNSIYDDAPPGFNWDRDALDRTEITYEIKATRTPSGVVLVGDVYNGAILKHSFNEMLTFTPPVQPTYSMETVLLASKIPFGSPLSPISDSVLQLEWEIASVIPEPMGAAGITMIMFLIAALTCHKVRKTRVLRQSP